MKQSVRGKPELPTPLPAALETWKLPWNSEGRLWSFTGLADVFEYLRGNKKLRIPPEWQPFVPYNFE